VGAPEAAASGATQLQAHVTFTWNASLLLVADGPMHVVQIT
jgi:hypothetical protein